MLRNDPGLLQKDKVFYQKCKSLLEELLKHISTADFSKDMVKKVLHGDMQRLNVWVEDELTNIESIEKGIYDNK